MSAIQFQILNYRYIFFAHYLKIYCNLVQIMFVAVNVSSQTLILCEICFGNGIILNIVITTIISFTRKSVSIKFNYKLFNDLIMFPVFNLGSSVGL
jgi:hypothetical protein